LDKAYPAGWLLVANAQQHVVAIGELKGTEPQDFRHSERPELVCYWICGPSKADRMVAVQAQVPQAFG